MIDVAVVGGGLSGLVCARRLVQGGASVTVLEARDRVGGRTLTGMLQGRAIDLGGQWMSPGQPRLAALAVELDVDTVSQDREGRAVIGLGDARPNLAARVPLFTALELGRRVTCIEAAGRAIDRGKAAQWDRVTLAKWMTQHVHSSRARDMIAMIAQLKFAAEPRELSFGFFAKTLEACGGLTDEARFDDGAREKRFVGGAQSLSTALADLLGDRVCVNAQVSSIVQHPERVALSLVPEPGTAGVDRQARYAVLALSPGFAARIHVEPAWPAARAALHERMPAGPVIKMFIAYDRPFWRDARLSGEAYSTAGHVRAVVDACAGDRIALLAFAVADSARELTALDPAARRHHVVAELVSLFGAPARAVTGWAEMAWAGADGAVANLVPGAMADCSAALSAPVGRIYIAGTESATRWPRYLEGAVEAGERAAADLLDLLG